MYSRSLKSFLLPTSLVCIFLIVAMPLYPAFSMPFKSITPTKSQAPFSFSLENGLQLTLLSIQGNEMRFAVEPIDASATLKKSFIWGVNLNESLNGQLNLYDLSSHLLGSATVLHGKMHQVEMTESFYQQSYLDTDCFMINMLVNYISVLGLVIELLMQRNAIIDDLQDDTSRFAFFEEIKDDYNIDFNTLRERLGKKLDERETKLKDWQKVLLISVALLLYVAPEIWNGCMDMDLDGYAPLEGDCDDDNAQINPGMEETPYNGLNDDCNAATLDDDLDQDGFDYLSDCDDTDAAVNPDMEEEIYNGKDDDCNIATLDDDLDQDGYTKLDGKDCDDFNSAVNPGQKEIPGNGKDDDCNSATAD